MYAREESRGDDRRSQTRENRVVRRMIDVLGWAANVPRGRQDDAKRVLSETHGDAVRTLREADTADRG